MPTFNSNQNNVAVAITDMLHKHRNMSARFERIAQQVRRTLVTLVSIEGSLIGLFHGRSFVC